MLDSFPIAAIAGMLMGYLAGIGVGGGSLLILWLTLVIGMDPSVARTINLMFFIASAGAVSLFRLKRGTLKLRKLLPAILAGCAGAAAFSLIGKHLDTKILRMLFGLLLLITGIRELRYRPKEK